MAEKERKCTESSRGTYGKKIGKIDRLAHKYALDISKFHEKTEIKIDFNNLNKDFYDDIELNDNKIKSNKKLLNKIKDLTLKEFVYTNKIIPDIWKNNVYCKSEFKQELNQIKNLKIQLNQIYSLSEIIGKDLIFNQGTANENNNNKGTMYDENYNLKLFQYNNKNTSISTPKITNVQKNICSITFI